MEGAHPFINNFAICTDSADAISKDLVEAGLIDGKNMVVGKFANSIVQDHIHVHVILYDSVPGKCPLLVN